MDDDRIPTGESQGNGHPEGITCAGDLHRGKPVLVALIRQHLKREPRFTIERSSDRDSWTCKAPACNQGKLPSKITAEHMEPLAYFSRQANMNSRQRVMSPNLHAP